MIFPAFQRSGGVQYAHRHWGTSSWCAGCWGLKSTSGFHRSCLFSGRLDSVGSGICLLGSMGPVHCPSFQHLFSFWLQLDCSLSRVLAWICTLPFLSYYPNMHMRNPPGTYRLLIRLPIFLTALCLDPICTPCIAKGWNRSLLLPI